MMRLRYAAFPVLLAFTGVMAVGADREGPPGLHIGWYTINGGGGESGSGSGPIVRGTIGQPESGVTSTGGNLVLAGGHWTPGACPSDTDFDFTTNVDDLVNVITLWGTSGQQPGVRADITDAFGGAPDGTVDVNDLNAVIINWGPCGF
jgi:hypothetical protein